MVCGVGDVCGVWCMVYGVCVCGVGKLRISKPIHCVDPDSQWRGEDLHPGTSKSLCPTRALETKNAC